jgi:hypothetical protein
LTNQSPGDNLSQQPAANGQERIIMGRRIDHRTFVAGLPVARTSPRAERFAASRPSAFLAPLSVGQRTRDFLADLLEDWPARFPDLSDLLVEDRR